MVVDSVECFLGGVVDHPAAEWVITTYGFSVRLQASVKAKVGVRHDDMFPAFTTSQASHVPLWVIA